MAIPTRNDVAELLPAGSSVASVRRKVAVLHDQLAVAWAGSEIGARHVIRDLRAFARGSEPDRERLFTFLDGYPDLGRGVHCELVGWLVDDRGAIAFHWDSKDVWAGGEEYVTGSGAKDFTDSAGRRDFFYSDDASVTPHEQVTHIALILAGYAVGREVLSGEPLRHRYGGGMEVAVFVDGRFAVITDIGFLFWRVEMDPKGDTFRGAYARTMLKYVHVSTIA